MNPSQQVAVTDGDGMVARRPASVLFVSSETQHQADLLVQEFLTAPSDITAMAAVLAAAHEVPPGVPEPEIAILRWTAESGHLLVRGDVRVTTDDPTLPFMNGAGLAGWIERSLFSLPVTVAAGSGAPNATAAVGGSVTGGGFTATIVADTTGAHDVVRNATVARAPVFPPDLVPPRGGPPRAPGNEGVGVGVGVGVESLIPPPPAVEPAYSALWDDPKRAGSAPTNAGAASPRLRSTFSHQPGVGAHRHTGPLRGRECMNHHPNPPEAASCRECGATLNPASGSLVEFPRSAIGSMKMGDGRTIALDRSVLVGRKPNADERSRWSDFTLVVSDDTKVSRNHLEVLVSGWDVQVVDCGSRNGTSVQFPGQPERESLTPGVPVFITVGASVRFGGQSFTFVAASGGQR